jgi:hypothetical protein
MKINHCKDQTTANDLYIKAAEQGEENAIQRCMQLELQFKKRKI